MIAGALAIGLAAGVVIGLPLVTCLILVVGVVIVAVAVPRPAVALALLLGVEVVGNTVIGVHAGLSPYLLALAIAMASVALAVARGSAIARSPACALAVILLVAAGISLLASPFTSAGLSPYVELVKDVLFLVTVVCLLRISGRYSMTLQVTVGVVAALALLSVLQQYVFHNSTTFHGLSNVPLGADIGAATPRHSGPEADVNFWGRTLVLFVPLGLSLVALRSERRRRLLWVVAVVAFAAGEYLTQSRGGILAFGAAILIWLGVRGLRRKRVLLIVPVLLVAAAFTPGMASRLGTLTQLVHSSSATTDPSLIGRITAQQLGLAMFADHPATGVGYGNFETAEPQYLDRPNITNSGSVIAPHDLYLQIAAEQGLLGLTAWFLFFGAALVLGVRVYLVSQRIGRSDWNAIALGCLAGLLGWAIASIVLHMADFRHLLIVVAILAALDLECREAARGLPIEDLARPPRDVARWKLWRRRAGGITAVYLIASALAVLGLVVLRYDVSLRSTSHVASASAEVQPHVATASFRNAYAWDTVSRRQLLLTFGAIAGNQRFVREAGAQLGLSPSDLRYVHVHADGDPGNAVLTVTATAPDPHVAEAMATASLAQARTYLNSITSVYEVAPPTPGSDRILHPIRGRVVALVVVVPILAAICVVLGALAIRPRRGQLGAPSYR